MVHTFSSFIVLDVLSRYRAQQLRGLPSCRPNSITEPSEGPGDWSVSRFLENKSLKPTLAVHSPSHLV